MNSLLARIDEVLTSGQVTSTGSVILGKKKKRKEVTTEASIETGTHTCGAKGHFIRTPRGWNSVPKPSAGHKLSHSLGLKARSLSWSEGHHPNPHPHLHHHGFTPAGEGPHDTLRHEHPDGSQALTKQSKAHGHYIMVKHKRG